MTDSERFYEDKHVKVDDKGITIYYYYYPRKTLSKTILWKNVKHYDRCNLASMKQKIEYKKWGKLVYHIFFKF